MDMNTPTRAEAFQSFAQQNWESLLRTAILLAGSRHLGEDLMQEAMVRTFTAWQRIEPDSALAYTRKVMANACTDRWRRKHLDIIPLDDAILTQHRSSGDPEGRFDDREEILDRLSGLSQRERTIVVLRYYWDLPEIEVAELISVSVGTVKSTASRALAKLRVPQNSAQGA